MSRFKRGKNVPGADMSWDTEGGGGEADGAPTPLYPVSIPWRHSISFVFSTRDFLLYSAHF